MVQEYTQGKLTWVDLKNPTNDEVRSLVDTYAIPPELVGDLTAVGTRPGAQCTAHAFKITMHFPIVRRTDINHPHEVMFIATKNVLVSVRYEDMEAIHQFQKEFEVITTLHKAGKEASGAHLLFALLFTLYSVLNTKLDYLEDRMDDISANTKDGYEKQRVFAISEVSRRLISFRHTLKSHEGVLTDAKEYLETCFTKTVTKEIDGLIEQYKYLLQRTNTLFETLEELRDTNFALLTTKQNEIMKILTIMAFITFPLSLFTSLFGMNTVHTPILGTAGDFWIIVGMMSLITLGFFGFFKYKNWI